MEREHNIFQFKNKVLHIKSSSLFQYFYFEFSLIILSKLNKISQKF